MTNMDKYYQVCNLIDNLNLAYREIDGEIRETYGNDIEQIISDAKAEQKHLENVLEKENKEIEKQQEKEYREMVGM